jgi:hypothetical protein
MPRCFSPNPMRLICTLLTFSLWLVLGSVASGQVQVITEHNDVQRTGVNPNETILTPSNVNLNTFGKLFTEPVDGYVVAQPLYMQGVKLPNGTTHNVVYVVTQHDSVYAFDADTPQAPLWQVSFINPAGGVTTVPITSFGCPGVHFTEIGIMSTPVIDPGSQTMYLVAKTEEPGAFIYRLHRISLTTGKDISTPSVINATATTNTGTLQFNSAFAMQRPALLLSNGTVYIGFGSNGCDTYAFHGWLLAYNALTLQPAGAFAVTPNGTKGAIWQSGGGPAADDDGTIFLATANGTFDANTGGNDYGDTVLHLNPASGGLSVLDYFTPFDQATLASSDKDLGSGGVLLVPDQDDGPAVHEVIAGGKEGTLYLIDRDHMGGYNPAGDTQIVQSIPHASTGRIDSVPIYWNGNVYLSGNSDFIRAYSFSNGLLSTQAVMQSSILFNIGGPGVDSLSANGSTNGILWAIIHNGTVPTLYALNASELSTELFDTRQAKLARDEMTGVARFVAPTIANGKVYIGGMKNFMVYGLLPVISPVSGNNQTGFVGTPINLQVAVNDAYAGVAQPNVAVNCKDGGVGGTFAAATVTTNATGTASFTYTLPAKAKSIIISCTSLGYTTATFSEVAAEGPPSRIVISGGNNQTSTPSTQLPVPFTVIVYDRFSRGVPGVTVTFSDNGAGGVVASPTVTTDATGHASTLYTTPGKNGVYTVQVSVAGVSTANIRVTVK